MASRLKRILVVDDEQLIRDIVSKMLTGSGFEVTVADTAYEGLDLFHKKEFDLVITDLEMPGMNGWSLASQIKEEAPEIPVVLITGSIRDDIEEKKGNKKQ